MSAINSEPGEGSSIFCCKRGNKYEELQHTTAGEPLIDGQPSNSSKQSPIQASLTMVKAVVGAGSFGLPYGFAQAGLWGGTVGLAVLGVLSGYTIKVLVDCKNKMDFDQPASYVDVVRKSLGRVAAVVVYIAICLTSLGACSGYLIFCGTMLNELFPDIDLKWFVLMLVVPIIPLTWLRSMKLLAFTSILGDAALLVGVVTVLVYGFMEQTLHSPFDTSQYDMLVWGTYPVFFGSAAFLFCIHMLVIPVEQAMKQPERFNPTLLASFIFVTILNMAFSFICYLMWGRNVMPIVVSNIGTTGAFVYIARFALVADLFFTFLVVIVPAREIVENSILGHDNPDEPVVWRKFVWRMALRTGMVLVAAALGIFVGHFDVMMGLVSGLALSLTAFIFPPIIRFKTQYLKDKTYTWKYIAIDFIIFYFGMLAAFATTYMALVDLLKAYNVQTCQLLPATWGHCPNPPPQ